ncbi:MAG: ubiquitin-like domain-containing protein [Anaerolineales bacterium]
MELTPSRTPARALRAAILLALLVGLGLVIRASAAPIEVILDGRAVRVHTHAATVAGALRGVGGGYRPGDDVSPDPSASVRPGMTIVWWRTASVWIESGHAGNWVETARRLPFDILDAAGTSMFPNDRLSADGIPLSEDRPDFLRPSRIEMAERHVIHVDLGGLQQSIHSSAPSLGEAMWDEGIRLREGDVPSEDLAGPIQEAATLGVQLAQPISVVADGEERQVWAAATTTGEALARAGVPLLGLDYAIPDVDSPLPMAGPIRVVRVTEQVVSVLEPIPFETTYEADPELEIDLQRLISSGTPGVSATSTRVRFEDGAEVSRFEEGTRIAREPAPRVVGYGTDIILRSIQTPDGPITYYRAVSMYATAYSPCHLGVPNYCSTITSSGKELAKGMVAFVLRWYRVMKGQAVYIPGYGIATVEDVGGGIPGRHWIDLGYTDAEIISWNRWVTVYFLAPVPPADRIYWILD